jgi:thioredoxin
MIRATWNGAVLAESDQTVKVEGNHYFPPESVRHEYLHDSATHTRCFWKGTASYYDVVVDDKTNADAAWYYPDPSPPAAGIAGHVAFWHGVRVGRVREDRDDAAHPRGSFLSRLGRRRQVEPAAPPASAPTAGDAHPAGTEDLVVTVTDDNFQTAVAEGFTVVDFWAPWCGPCLQLAPIFDAAAGRHQDQLRFGRCDVDQNPQTAARLGIMSIPTLILFDQSGREIDRLIGVPNPRKLDAFLTVPAQS